MFLGRADENDGGGDPPLLQDMQVAELKEKVAPKPFLHGAVRNGGSSVDARNAAVMGNSTGEEVRCDNYRESVLD